MSPEDGARIGKDLAFSTKVLVDTTLALDEMVCRELDSLKPDVVVADSMAVWGKAVALKKGIPFVSSTTTFAFNQHSAKIMKQSMGQIFGMIFSMGKIQKDIARLQAKGYPINNVLDIIQNDNNTDTVVYTSPQFQPCAETFSDKYAFVGPSIRPAESEIEKKADKLIYISMGTVNNNFVKFYKNCIKALGETDYQVIISVGEQVDVESLGEIPENIEIYKQVDQIAVLEKADAFLTHCGMNSASEALYHEVPLLMYPQTSEQGAVATRTQQLGAGTYLKKTTAEAIRAGVEELLNNSTYKEKVVLVSKGFKECTGARGAADRILSCIK